LDLYGWAFFDGVEPLSVHEWATSNVELSPRITEQPGPYSTRLHPYVDEILEAVADPYVKRVSLCWGSQTAKTTTFYVMLGHVIDRDPRAILWVFPNLALCKAFSSERWQPFCRESKALVKHLPRYMDGTIDEDRFSLTKQEFARCTMNLVGAGSAANVRSYPVSVLVLDEIDVIDERTRRECMDRIKGKHDYKVLQSSTPVMIHGGIWEEFQQGDRRRYLMPCPNCAQPMLFRLKDDEGELNIKWDKKANLAANEFDLGVVQKSAFYVCEKCGGKILDGHKTKMLRDGNWEATSSSSELGFHSYHLNSIYSPVITFGRVAVEYLKAKGAPGAMGTFVNGWLAEPYNPAEGSIDPEKFKIVERKYKRGTIKGTYRIIGVDVQRSVFFWVIRGFDRDGKSWLVDHGTAPAFDDLTALAHTYECAYGIIDTGYRTQEIYEEIHARRPFWFGCKGWERLPHPYKMTGVDPFSPVKQGKVKKAVINLLNINKDVWQGELLKRRNGTNLNWFTYKDTDPEYVRQMLSTNHIERTDRRGKVKWEWVVEGHKQDHYWDCETYILTLSHVFGLGGAVIRKGKDLADTDKARPAKRAPTRPVKKSIW
tara:strand:+ start:1253 stop:3046 length:1794 start_codon:yes stop_codon:yes gene_type:complete